MQRQQGHGVRGSSSHHHGHQAMRRGGSLSAERAPSRQAAWGGGALRLLHGLEGAHLEAELGVHVWRKLPEFCPCALRHQLARPTGSRVLGGRSQAQPLRAGPDSGQGHWLDSALGHPAPHLSLQLCPPRAAPPHPHSTASLSEGGPCPTPGTWLLEALRGERGPQRHRSTSPGSPLWFFSSSRALG